MAGAYLLLFCCCYLWSVLQASVAVIRSRNLRSALPVCCSDWRSVLQKKYIAGCWDIYVFENGRHRCQSAMQEGYPTLHHMTIHWNRLQHTGTHCNTLQHTATHRNAPIQGGLPTRQPAATHCNPLKPAATHCNTLHHTAPHCTNLYHTATHCDILQHTATHCNTLQHTATDPEGQERGHGLALVRRSRQGGGAAELGREDH